MPAPADRSHLSIGEVLSLLQDEFPDVTISKIRFLESQGLLDPERTPSGYRKFYETDIERLRWILRQQKDNYLPLKVIKDRLDDIGQPGPAPREPQSGGGSTDRAAAHHSGDDAAGRPGAEPALDIADADSPARLSEGPSSRGSQTRSATFEQRVAPSVAARSAGPRTARADNGAATGLRRGAAAPARPMRLVDGAGSDADAADSVSFTIEELAAASGLSVRDLRELEHFGLIAAEQGVGASSYDSDALVVARVAGGFLQHGIEARHLRSYRVAVDREAGLFQQIVAPLLKQRNPEAHRRATRTVAELMQLGEAMRAALLRRELRDHIDQ